MAQSLPTQPLSSGFKRFSCLSLQEQRGESRQESILCTGILSLSAAYRQSIAEVEVSSVPPLLQALEAHIPPGPAVVVQARHGLATLSSSLNTAAAFLPPTPLLAHGCPCSSSNTDVHAPQHGAFALATPSA
ncbi:hypothetical protein AAY473_007741 [Plecturocebus cupreus]